MDGKTWERHYHDPELQGQVVAAIAAQGNAVWIGTQKRGLLRYANGKYTAYQEPQGLTDDSGAALAATPLGLYREDTSNHWRLTDARRSGGLETQAVLPCAPGTWVATRTSLAFIPRHDL